MHVNTSIHPKTGKNSNTQANLASKGTGKRTANNTYTQQKKRVNRVEQNSIKQRPEELWNRLTKPGDGSLKELIR